LEGLFSWHTIRFILDAALWVYYANFPLLFKPVDLLRKFGYGGPVGHLIDLQGGAVVARSLSEADYRAFKEYAEAQDDARNVLEWAVSRPDLTDDEIKATWNETEYGAWPGLFQGYGMQMARLRALRVAMALRKRARPDPPEAVFNLTQSIGGWKKLSQARGRRVQ
jgi:hypothetical protein